jgi:hypothetical protein
MPAMKPAVSMTFRELRQLAWMALRAMPLALLLLALAGWVRSRQRADGCILFLHVNVGAHADMLLLNAHSRPGAVGVRFEIGQTPNGEASMAAVLPAFEAYRGPAVALDPPRTFWDRIQLHFRATKTPIMADFIGTARPAPQVFMTVPYWAIASLFAGIIALQRAARRHRIRRHLPTARHFPVNFLRPQSFNS